MFTARSLVDYEQVAEVNSVTGKQIDSILPFLDRFEEAGFSAGNWNNEPGQMPWFNFDESVKEFYQVLYDNNWVTLEFDWTEWQDAAKEYVESSDKIASADVVTVQKLFTTHVRKDRFCKGHLASMFKNGHLLALLRRLKEIREVMRGEDKDNWPDTT